MNGIRIHLETADKDALRVRYAQERTDLIYLKIVLDYLKIVLDRAGFTGCNSAHYGIVSWNVTGFQFERERQSCVLPISL
jgi:hypothetical protein